MKLSGPQGERDELWQIGRKTQSKSRGQRPDEFLASSYPHSEKLVLRPLFFIIRLIEIIKTKL